MTLAFTGKSGRRRAILVAAALFAVLAAVVGGAASRGFDGAKAAESAYREGTSSSITGTCDNPTNAASSNDNRAECGNGETITAGGFGLSALVPAGAVNIRFGVRVETGVSNTNGNDKAAVSLSWNGGTSFTSATNSGSIESVGDSEVTVPSDGSCSDFGRTWSASELTDANFFVRIAADIDAHEALNVDDIDVKICWDIPGPVSGDNIVPTYVTKDDAAGWQCPAGLTEFKFDNEPRGSKTGSADGITFNATIVGEDTFSWSTTGGTVDYVFVKGGNAGSNLYAYSPEDNGDTGLGVPDPSNNAISHISFCYDIDPPDVGVSKSSNPETSVAAGGSVTWTVTIAVTGSATTAAATIVDTLPSGFELVSSSESSASLSCVDDTTLDKVTCTLVSGAPVGTYTFTVTATAPSDPGPQCPLLYTNNVAITAGGGSNTQNDTASDGVTVQCPIVVTQDVTFAKYICPNLAAIPAAPAQGQPVTFPAAGGCTLATAPWTFNLGDTTGASNFGTVQTDNTGTKTVTLTPTQLTQALIGLRVSEVTQTGYNFARLRCYVDHTDPSSLDGIDNDDIIDLVSAGTSGVYCIAYNVTATRTITVKKVVTNVVDDGTAFDFDLNGSATAIGSVAETSTTGFDFTGVSQSAQVVNEAGETGYTGQGWALANSDGTCPASPPTGSTANQSGTDNSAEIAAGSANVVVCFYNKKDLGKITVNKVCDPTGDTGKFNLLINSSQTSDVACGGTTGPQSLVPGTYTISETAGTGTNLANYTTTGPVCINPQGGVTHPVVLAAGDDVVCTITNTRKGTIIIEKQTTPNGSLQSFTFTGQIATTLSDGQNASQTVDPGTYTVTESSQTGWVLDSISCDDTNSSGDAGTGVATFNVAAGETVKCTFNNSAVGSIVITKNDSTLVVDNQRPTDGDWDFVVRKSASIVYTRDIALNTAAGTTTTSVTINNVPLGTYSVDEIEAHLESREYACPDQPNIGQDGYLTTLPVNSSQTLSAPGGSIEFIFTNAPCPSTLNSPTLTVRKVIDFNGNGIQDGGDTLANGWGITVTCGSEVQGGTTGANGAGTVFFPSTAETTCTVAETTQAGYVSTVKWSKTDSGASSSGTGSSTTVTQDVNDNNVVTFYNQPFGSLVIKKVNHGGPAGDGFTADIANGAQNIGFTASSPSALQSLAPGGYTVSEDPRAGYDQLGWALGNSDGFCPSSATNSGATAGVTVSGGATTTLCFYNRPRITINVHKTEVTNGVPSNGNGWVFTLSGCGLNPVLTATTTGSGNASWTVPAAISIAGVPCTYTVTETQVAGWTVAPASGTQTTGITTGSVTLEFTNSRIFNLCVGPCITIVTPTPVPPTPVPPTPVPPTSTPVPPTATNTPLPPVTDTVAGVKTPGALSTPIAPSAGTGLAGDSASADILLAIAGLAAVALGLALVGLGRKQRTE